MLGLALVDMNLGDTKTGQAWFQLLRVPLMHHQVRDQVGFWQVWALLRADQSAAANDLAEKEIAAMSDAFTQGKLSLAVVLIRHGMAGAHSGADALRQNLGWLGAQGLIRIRRFDLARQLIFKYSIGKGKQEGFVFRFIEAQNTLEEANRVRDRATYQKAVQQLQAALASADAAKEPLLAAESQLLDRPVPLPPGRSSSQALTAFKQAALTLKVLKSTLAADAAWMTAVTALRQAEREPARKSRRPGSPPCLSPRVSQPSAGEEGGCSARPAQPGRAGPGKGAARRGQLRPGSHRLVPPLLGGLAARRPAAGRRSPARGP